MAGYLPYMIAGGAQIVSSIIGKDDPQKIPTAPAWHPDKGSFTSPTGGWGAPKGWMEQSKVNDPSSKWIDKARHEQWGTKDLQTGALGDQQWAFGQQRGALDMLARRARGEDSMAQEAARQQLDRARKAVASKVASMPGGYNPAMQHEALQQMSGMGAQSAGDVALAAAQERQAAQQAYMNALLGHSQSLYGHSGVLAGIRGQDIASQGLEQGQWKNYADWEAQKNQLKQQWMALGLQDKEAERNARMKMQEMELAYRSNPYGAAALENEAIQQQYQPSQSGLTYDEWVRQQKEKDITADVSAQAWQQYKQQQTMGGGYDYMGSNTSYLKPA